VARNHALASKVRTGITAVDTAVPAAPEDSQGNVVTPLPAGVVGTDGDDKIKVDVLAPATATGNTLLNVYAWNSALAAWVMEGAQFTVPTITTGDFTGRLVSRVTIVNWCSKFCWVAVATLATNGGSGVGTAVSVTSCRQDK
jgi:hypothetical protein